MARITRSLEAVFIGFSFFIVLVVAWAADFISHTWINSESVADEVVANSVILMGVAIGGQLLTMLYQGGLNGLERQLSVNVLLTGGNIFRGVAGIVSLVLTKGSLEWFFASQAAVSALLAFAMRVRLWSSFPVAVMASERINFRAIVPLLGFAGGMAAIGVTSILLTQMDKIVLSHFLSLESFAYFSLASILASIPVAFAGPVGSAVYPRLTRLIEIEDWQMVAKLYHTACQISAVVVFPIAATMIFLPESLVLMWTGDAQVAYQVAPLLRILAVGSSLLAIMIIPYRLQLAAGWTRLPLMVNVVAIIALLPPLIFVADAFGAKGAIWIWVALNAVYVLVTIQLMHSRLLKQEKIKWYFRDIGKPCFLAFSASALPAIFLVEWSESSRLAALLSLSITFVFGFFSAALIVETSRNRLLHIFSKFRVHYLS